MKKLIIILILCVFNVTAQTSYNFNLGCYSAYWVEAGFKLSDGPVCQTSLSATKNKWTMFIWQNSELDGNGITEVDLGISYSFNKIETNIGDISSSIEIGYWEFSETLGGGNLKVITPTISLKTNNDYTLNYTVNQLLGENQGRLHKFKIGKSFKFNNKTYLNPYLLFSQPEEFLTLESTIVQLGIKTNFELNKNVSFGTKLVYQDPLKTNLKNGFFGGVSLNFSF